MSMSGDYFRGRIGMECRIILDLFAAADRSEPVNLRPHIQSLRNAIRNADISEYVAEDLRRMCSGLDSQGTAYRLRSQIERYAQKY